MASAVAIARLGFPLLGLLMLSALVYTSITDGSPFRKSLLTPWMVTTLIDFYINLTPILVWVWYKETSWLNALIWTIILICLGSMATCLYITIKLFQLSPLDPLYFVLLKEDHWRLLESKRLEHDG